MRQQSHNVGAASFAGGATCVLAALAMVPTIMWWGLLLAATAGSATGYLVCDLLERQRRQQTWQIENRRTTKQLLRQILEDQIPNPKWATQTIVIGGLLTGLAHLAPVAFLGLWAIIGAVIMILVTIAMILICMLVISQFWDECLKPFLYDVHENPRVVAALYGPTGGLVAWFLASPDISHMSLPGKAAVILVGGIFGLILGTGAYHLFSRMRAQRRYPLTA